MTADTSLYVLGIDVGGTNTDAVIMKDDKLIGKAKKTTTNDIVSGLRAAVLEALFNSGIAADALKRACVGTTHAVNALLQKHSLYKTGVIRIAGQHPDILSPGSGWPEVLRENIITASATVDGGFECDGRIINAFCDKEFVRVVRRFQEAGVESIALCGVFSPLFPEQERLAAEIVKDVTNGVIPVSISSDIGGLGYIGRENATIINAALKKCMMKGFCDIAAALQTIGVKAPVYVTGNNGTMLDIVKVMEQPALTLASGPTNSFLGAARLVELKEAVIVDIGGTSSDAGIVLDGYPRRSIGVSEIAGLALNFSMPDVISVNVGGGSLIRPGGAVGPESVGSQLMTQGLCFGGDIATLTDAALVCGIFAPDEVTVAAKNRCCNILDRELSEKAIDFSAQRLIRIIERIRGYHRNLPVVLVGGGSKLFCESHFKNISVLKPDDADVANACGAAFAELSSAVERIVSLDNRDKVLAELEEEATQLVAGKGAKAESIRIIERQIFNFNYMPGNKARVVITAAGKTADD